MDMLDENQFQFKFEDEEEFEGDEQLDLPKRTSREEIEHEAHVEGAQREMEQHDPSSSSCPMNRAQIAINTQDSIPLSEADRIDPLLTLST